MTMLLALGRHIARRPVARGRVVLMFQPAEEDGSGAKAVVADPAFEAIKPDWAFAIHIEPGRPFGHVSTCAGLINCASLGLAIKLVGKTAHAADPQDGVSPARAIARLIPALDDLGDGGALDHGFRLATITHVQIGEPTFGIAPGDGVIYTTLRTTHDDGLAELETQARALAVQIAREHDLGVEFEIFDHFAASINDEDAFDVASKALDAINITHSDAGVPMRASEDFGVFGWGAKAAMLCLGPGENYAGLHNPDYDFPDDLIPVGSAIFERIARDLLGFGEKVQDK
jgi:amidohydrolase